MWQAGFTYSVIAGIMSIALFFWALKNRDETIYLFSLLFLIVSWSGIEWALWILGYNLFQLVFQPIVPLASYFVAWTLFVIYASEKFFARRDWILFLLAVLAIIAIAHFCMDCL
jgi:energy-converting hydrogenase Eha subunit G